MWSTDQPSFAGDAVRPVRSSHARLPGTSPLRWLRPAFSLLALALTVEAAADIKVGDRFPSLAAANLTGGAVPETDGKVLLVDFWASWCAPCKASFPAYARLQAEFGSRGLAVIAVSADENPAAYESFLKKMQPSFATVRDEAHQLARAVNVPAMPTCFLVGRDGRVRFVHLGFHGAETDLQLHLEIEKTLNEKGPS